jgi:prepilin-type N-terminal cleavage/methylation domain-containing protein
MYPRSRRTPRSNRFRGFTLIEMTVTITVLLVMAALVLPNAVAIQRSRQIRLMEASLQRLPSEAKMEARKANAPVTLRVDGDAIVMEQIPVGEDAGGDPIEIRRVTLTNGIRMEKATQGQETVDTASWEWRVYPDGSSAAVNLEFLEDGAVKSLVIGSEGDAHWVNGEESEVPDERWAAGDIEVRAGS